MLTEVYNCDKCGCNINQSASLWLYEVALTPAVYECYQFHRGNRKTIHLCKDCYNKYVYEVFNI